MSIQAPRFITSPFFEITEEGQWQLRVGAPKAIRDEFEAYNRMQKEAKENGILL